MSLSPIINPIGLTVRSPLWPSAASDTLSTIVSDSFTDTDGTALTSHTPDTHGADATYREVAIFGGGLNFEINNNKARPDTTGSTLVGAAVIDAGKSDVAVSAVVNKGGIGDAIGGVGLCFRASGTSFYLLELVNSTVRIREYTSGVATVVDSAAFAYDASTDYELKVVLSGDSIVVYVDDVFILSTTDSTHSGTEHGISCTTFGAGRSTADNLLIVG